MPNDSGYSKSRTGDTALSAPRLIVGAEVTLEGNCEVIGGIDLSMSDMGSLSARDSCSLRASGRTALDLTNSELRSSLSFDSEVTVRGTLRLTGARSHGNLSLQGVTLTNEFHISGRVRARRGRIIRRSAVAPSSNSRCRDVPRHLTRM